MTELWKQWAVTHLMCVYITHQKLLGETLRTSDYIQSLNVHRKTNSDHLTELFPYGNNAHSLCSLLSAFIVNPHRSTLSVHNQLLREAGNCPGQVRFESCHSTLVLAATVGNSKSHPSQRTVHFSNRKTWDMSWRLATLTVKNSNSPPPPQSCWCEFVI